MSKSFVEAFIDFTQESETPTSFWRWGAYAIVAGALRDNVFWLQRGHKICTNIYVLLNSDSATHRKSGPIKEADSLLGGVKNTKVIRGRGSIQAMLEELSGSAMDRETGKSIRGGSCLLVADELRSFFVGDDGLVSLLTDIYDYRDSFDYKLRGNGFKIKNLCVSMLAASNDEFLKMIYTGEAVFGGLLGRTFLVKANEYKPGTSLLELEGDEEKNKVKYDSSHLVTMLKEISKLNGKIRFEIDAKIVYDEWYLALRESYKKKPDRTGVLARLHTGVVKLAVILAVSRRVSLIVKKEDISDAIDECVGLLPNYEGYAMSVGKSTEATAGVYLMNEMWAKGGSVSREEFLRKYWYEVSSEILDKLVATLTGAGMIKEGWNPVGSIATFVMTEKCKEIFQRSQITEEKNENAAKHENPKVDTPGI